MIAALCLTLCAVAQDGTLDDALEALGTGKFRKAHDVLLPLAEGGDMTAMFHLAGLYRSGRGVTQNDDRALHWIARAAAAGHETALDWLEAGAKADDPTALLALGRLHLEGSLPSNDEIRGRELVRRARSLGNEDAAWFFVRYNVEAGSSWRIVEEAIEALPDRGTGPRSKMRLAELFQAQQDPAWYARAIELWVAAMEAGHEEARTALRARIAANDRRAMYAMALDALKREQREEAMGFLRRAAALHHPPSLRHLGEMLLASGEKREVERGRALIAAATRLEPPRTASKPASTVRVLDVGEWTETYIESVRADDDDFGDLELDLRLVLSALRAGKERARDEVFDGWVSPQKVFVRAVAHGSGAGVPKNLALCEHLLRDLAEAGHVPARARLGTMLLTGALPGRDAREGMRWLQSAANQGHPRAWRRLMELDRSLNLAPEGAAEAAAWYGRALASGVAGARPAFEVGRRLIAGEGVRADAERGWNLVTRASDEGSRGAFLWLREHRETAPASAGERVALSLGEELPRGTVQRLADAGVPRGMVRLARLLAESNASEERVRSRALCANAARSGDILGMLELSLVLEAESPVEAYAWARLASEIDPALREERDELGDRLKRLWGALDAEARLAALRTIERFYRGVRDP